MADFKEAFEVLEKWEGGYSNHEADTGGETYKGITRKNYPSMSFWTTIDNCKKNGLSSKQINEMLGKDETVEQEIEIFYRDCYWNKFNGDEIKNQDFATNLLLLTVNAGVKRGIKVGQEACDIGVDGIYGRKTKEAFNKATDENVKKFNEIEIRFYESLVEKRPANKVFLNGWKNRANAI